MQIVEVLRLFVSAKDDYGSHIENYCNEATFPFAYAVALINMGYISCVGIWCSILRYGLVYTAYDLMA